MILRHVLSEFAELILEIARSLTKLQDFISKPVLRYVVSVLRIRSLSEDDRKCENCLKIILRSSVNRAQVSHVKHRQSTPLTVLRISLAAATHIDTHRHTKTSFTQLNSTLHDEFASFAGKFLSVTNLQNFAI